MFQITKWCKSITDDGKDHKVCDKPEGMDFKFRLLDDDSIVYAYGYSDKENFAPLNKYQGDYGCTEIQYKNREYDKWETL